MDVVVGPVSEFCNGNKKSASTELSKLRVFFDVLDGEKKVLEF